MFIRFLFSSVLACVLIAPELVASVSIKFDSATGNYKLSNGLVDLIFSTSGHLNSLSYGPVSNIFNSLGPGRNAYYDCNFGTDSGQNFYENFHSDSFKVNLSSILKRRGVNFSPLYPGCQPNSKSNNNKI